MKALEHATNQTDLRTNALTGVRFDIVKVGSQQELNVSLATAALSKVCRNASPPLSLLEYRFNAWAKPTF